MLGGELLLAALLLFLSAVFSGCETGFYCLSPLRVQAEAASQRSSARLIQALLRDEYTLLVTILVGNNLMIELLTRIGDDIVSARALVPEGWTEVAVTAVLTPIVFFCAELVPKELFRHRPHLLVGAFAPVIAAARTLFFPVAVPLRALSLLVVRLMRVESGDLSRALGREAVVDLLAEGTRLGRIEPRAERLALNVLALRGIRIETEMIPWQHVERLDARAPDAELRRRAATSKFSRLPVVGPEGVTGYVHQLDVLRAGPDEPVLAQARPLPTLSPKLSVDRALLRLRRTGQRAALVGSPGDPRGLVTLKDLVETISGDLAGW